MNVRFCQNYHVLPLSFLITLLTYCMNFFWLIPFITVILLSALSGSIYFSGSKDKVKMHLLRLNMSLLFWAIFDAIAWISHFHNDTGIFMERVKAIFWISPGYLFLAFSYALLKREKDFIYYLTLVLTFVFIGLVFFTDKIVKGSEHFYWGDFPVFGQWMLAVTLFLIAPMFFCVYLLARAYKSEENEHTKKAYLSVIIGSTISILLATITSVFLPKLFNIRVISMSDVGNAILSFYLFRAIGKYRFLQLNLEEIGKIIFDKVGEGIVITSQKGEILMMNKSVQQLLGVHHKDFSSIIEPGGSDSGIVKTKLINPVTGENTYLNISGNNITDERQRQLRLYIINDVSELVKYRNSLLDRNEELQISLYRIGHDLKSPAGAIKQLVELSKLDPDGTKEYLEKIEISAGQLLNFIKEVENLIRIKEAQPANDKVDMDRLLSRCWDELEFFRQGQNHVLHRKLNVKEITSDNLLVYTIVLNVLSNAIKYNDIAAKKVNDITVSTELKNNKVEISISDTGSGMDETTCANVYKLFYRGNNEVKGAGLGMYIVKHAVEKLDGEIQVSSKPGEGTTFRIIIPLKKV